MALFEWIGVTLHSAYKGARARWYQRIIESERNRDRIVVFKTLNRLCEVVIKSEGGTDDPKHEFD
jgi:hypothetical protein